MKHLITKWLLVMVGVFGVSLWGEAAYFYLSGNANGMDSSEAYTWRCPMQKLSTDANGDIYFWANGEFALSTQNGSDSDWGNFNNNRILINYSNGIYSANFSNHSNTNAQSNWNGNDKDSDGKWYVKFHDNGNNSATVTVQNHPFGTTEPSDSDDSLPALYIGKGAGSGAPSGVRIPSHDGAYDTYTYVATSGEQFHFFNGNVDGANWIGPAESVLTVADDGETVYSTLGNGNYYAFPHAGTFYIAVSSFDGNNNLKFTVTSALQPEDVVYSFWSNSTSSSMTKDFELVRNEATGVCSYNLSGKDMAGKQFGIEVADKDGNRLHFFIPNSQVDANDIHSYTLHNSATPAFFPSNAKDGMYTIVVEFGSTGLPSRFRVNPPADSSYNQTLFVGIASANRHEIKMGTSGYEPYYFYVNEENLTAATENGENMFGFRFYSEPNGGTWMGGSEQTQVEFDKVYTTSGIRRYFIDKTGAYVINVQSYDPVKSEVVFSISEFDGEIVLPDLYIGGTWTPNGLENGTPKELISHSKGKYDPKTVTAEAGAQFRFYSQQTNGSWMGPVGHNNTAIDTTVESDGTQLAYTTVGNDYVFTFLEAGTYEINVSEYLSTENKVTFTARKVSQTDPVEAPATLYMRSSLNWDAPVEMTFDDELGAYVADVNYTGGDLEFHFRQNANDWNGMLLYPSVNGSAVSKNLPVSISNIDESGNDPYKAWVFNSSLSEMVKVIVNFNKEVPTVEVMGTPDKTYYFIGDLNEWFSKEFEPGLEDQKGINAEKFEANKDDWKFDYVGDGWYKFAGFPEGLLTGHFQIVSGGTWEVSKNEIYSHVVTVNANDIENNQLNGYRAFKMNRITRDDIRNGNQYRIRKRDESNSNGSNLGTQCNAVSNATLYFKPGDMPRIRLVGEPVDYFMFYNMEQAEGSDKYQFNPDKKVDAAGEETDEYWVRAHINSGKPNTNNYFLAGIQYGGVTLPFVDINGNSGAHMNIGDGIDLAPYDLKSMSETELNNLFFGQEDIVNCIKEGELPNGRDITVYDKVWVAKIPSGFEDPAGTKYNMTFTKAMTENDRTSERTITPRHYYFFPQLDGIHVHINADNIENLSNVDGVDVAYRLYKTNAAYNTVVVKHGKDGRETTVIRNKDEQIKPTSESRGVNEGWYEMTRKEETLWNCNPAKDHPLYSDSEWLVSWEDDAVAAVAENGETAQDFRREVSYDDNSAFVQFRITIKLNTPLSVAGRSNAPVSEYTVYVPESTDIANDAYHFGLNNKDLYVKIGNEDGVWTGLNDILDEIGGETATPVYYNLQGVRVDNPDKGIFIKVTGSKSEKVMF